MGKAFLMETLLAKRLVEQREFRDLTQLELSKRSGISVGCIRQLEQGTRFNPSYYTILSICVGLDVPSNFFDDCYRVDVDTTRGKQRNHIPTGYGEAVRKRRSSPL